MPNLFDSINLGPLRLKNRAVMAPMTRARAPGNIPSPEMARYYAQRANAGLIVTEGTVISPEGSGFVDCPGLWSADQVLAWQPVTQAVHDQGAAIFTQIWHVGRMSHVSLQPGGAAPVSSTVKQAVNSSAFGYLPDGSAGFVPASKPRALESDEIARVVEDFAQAAENAILAGFDGVEIHGANGYLIEQFLNGAVNDRSDRYGSQSVENRIRFALEVVDACIARIGAERVGIRLSPFGRLHELGDFKGEAETFLTLARALADRDIAFIHVMDQASRGAPAMPEGFLASFRAAFPRILILAGGMDRQKSDAMLAKGLIDMAAFGAAFTSNPDLIERMRHGWPITAPDPASFYGGAARDLTCWPTWLEQA